MNTFDFFYTFILKNFFETSCYPSKKEAIQLKPITEDYHKVLPNLVKIYDIDGLKLYVNMNNSFRLLLIIKNNKHIIIRLNNDSRNPLIGFICDNLVFTFYCLNIQKVLEYLFYILD